MTDLKALKAKIERVAYELNSHRLSSDAYRSADSALNLVSRATRFGLDEIAADGLATAFAALQSPEYGEFLAKDEEIVSRYSALVKEHNAIVRARRNERANAKEAAKIRAAACSCGLVHAGECY